MTPKELKELEKNKRKVLCRYCQNISFVSTSDWNNISYIPWCKADFPELFNKLPVDFTRQQMLDTYKVIRPNELQRAERLEVELDLRMPCMCNVCRGER